MRMVRKSDQFEIARMLGKAESFGTRLKGLIGVKSFAAGQGLLFPKCNSVHMWMMSVPIDVVFLKPMNSEWVVSSIFENLKPWKVFPVMDLRAQDALELPAGTVKKAQLKKGEVLCTVS